MNLAVDRLFERRGATHSKNKTSFWGLCQGTEHTQDLRAFDKDRSIDNKARRVLGYAK